MTVLAEGSLVRPDEQREQYKRDGVVVIRQLVNADAAINLLSEAEQIEKSTSDHRKKMNLSTQLSGYWDCVSPLVAIAATLMNSLQVRLYNDHLFVKRGGDSVATDWHQDLPFWPFKGEQIIAAWLALTPVRREASAVHYARGSHRWNKFYRPAPLAMKDPTHPDYLALEPCPDYFDVTRADGIELLSWDMEPGDVLWHNGLTMHGAKANAPGNPLRAGLTVRFLGDDVTWCPQPYFNPAPRVPTVAVGERISGDDTFPLLWPQTSSLERSLRGMQDPVAQVELKARRN